MNKLLVCALCLLLTACASQSKIVYVPTAVECPKPHLAPEPNYMPITKDMRSSEAIKALVVNYKYCRADVEALRKQCGANHE
jgi:hypothetical protein